MGFRSFVSNRDSRSIYRLTDNKDCDKHRVRRVLTPNDEIVDILIVFITRD